MCELVAMSTLHPTNLTLSLRELTRHSSRGRHVDGWGVAYYHDSDVMRVRDTTAAYDSPWAKFVAQCGCTSKLVIAHIRKATQGAVLLENTQPFEREMGGRMHIFAHNGDLPEVCGSKRYQSQYHRPIGSTDSETVFCYLLDRLREPWSGKDKPDFSIRWQIFQEFCNEFRSRGPANFLYSDSEYLFVHGNHRKYDDGQQRPPGLHYLCRECSHKSESGLTGKAITVARADSASPDLQRVMLVASVPLTTELWMPMYEGEMIAARNGKIVARVKPS